MGGYIVPCSCTTDIWAYWVGGYHYDKKCSVGNYKKVTI